MALNSTATLPYIGSPTSFAQSQYGPREAQPLIVPLQIAFVDYVDPWNVAIDLQALNPGSQFRSIHALWINNRGNNSSLRINFPDSSYEMSLIAGDIMQASVLTNGLKFTIRSGYTTGTPPVSTGTSTIRLIACNFPLMPFKYAGL